MASVVEQLTRIKLALDVGDVPAASSTAAQALGALANGIDRVSTAAERQDRVIRQSMSGFDRFVSQFDKPTAAAAKLEQQFQRVTRAFEAGKFDDIGGLDGAGRVIDNLTLKFAGLGPAAQNAAQQMKSALASGTAGDLDVQGLAASAIRSDEVTTQDQQQAAQQNAARQSAVTSFTALERRLNPASAAAEKFAQDWKLVNAALAANPALAERASAAIDALAKEQLGTKPAAQVATMQAKASLGGSDVEKNEQSVRSAALKALSGDADNAAKHMEGVGHASAGVTREIVVMAHEVLMGNWSRLGGSFLVLSERMETLRKIVSGLFSPAFLVPTAIVGALAAITIAGETALRSVERIQNSLVGVRDNYKELGQQIREASRDLAASTPLNRTEAGSLLTSVYQQPNFQGTQVQAQTIIKEFVALNEMLGEAAGDAKHLTEAFQDPVRLIDELANRHIKGFSVELENQARLYVAAGDKAKAISLILDRLAPSAARVQENLTPLEKAMRGLNDAFNKLTGSGDGLAVTLGVKLANSLAADIEQFTKLGEALVKLPSIIQTAVDKILDPFGSSNRADAVAQEEEQGIAKRNGGQMPWWWPAPVREGMERGPFPWQQGVAQPSPAPVKIGDGGDAVGMFQLHASAARDVGLNPEGRFDYYRNITGGASYFRQQIDSLGNLDDATRAFHRPQDIPEGKGFDYLGSVRDKNPATLDPKAAQDIGAAVRDAFASYRGSVPLADILARLEQIALKESGGRHFEDRPSVLPQTAPLGTSPADFASLDYVQRDTASARTGQLQLETRQFNGTNYTVASQFADRVDGFLKDLEAAGYKIKSIQGYNDRTIARTNTPSFHASGAAFDINPLENPVNGSTNLPPNVQEIAKRWGLGWGGAWTGGKTDPMHFSFARQEGGDFDVPRMRGGVPVGGAAPPSAAQPDQHGIANAPADTQNDVEKRYTSTLPYQRAEVQAEIDAVGKLRDGVTTGSDAWKHYTSVIEQLKGRLYELITPTQQQVRTLGLEYDVSKQLDPAMRTLVQRHQELDQASIKSTGHVANEYEHLQTDILARGLLSQQIQQSLHDTDLQVQANDRMASSYERGTGAVQAAEARNKAIQDVIKSGLDPFKEGAASVDALTRAYLHLTQQQDRAQIGGQVFNQRQQLGTTQLETELVGKPVTAQSQALAERQAIVAGAQVGLAPDDAQVQKLIQVNKEIAAANDNLTLQRQSWQEIEQTGGRAIDTLGDGLLRVFETGKITDFKKAVSDMLGDVAKEMLKLTLLNPLKNFLFGSNQPTIGSVGGQLGNVGGGLLGGLFGGGGGGGGGGSGGGGLGGRGGGGGISLNLGGGGGGGSGGLSGRIARWLGLESGPDSNNGRFAEGWGSAAGIPMGSDGTGIVSAGNLGGGIIQTDTSLGTQAWNWVSNQFNSSPSSSFALVNDGGQQYVNYSYHSGGVAGRGSPRGLPSSMWAEAPRYHSGVQLAHDEVPAILQRGEVVLTQKQQASVAQHLGTDWVAQALGRNTPKFAHTGMMQFHEGGVVDWLAGLFSHARRYHIGDVVDYGQNDNQQPDDTGKFNLKDETTGDAGMSGLFSGGFNAQAVGGVGTKDAWSEDNQFRGDNPLWSVLGSYVSSYLGGALGGGGSMFSGALGQVQSGLSSMLQSTSSQSLGEQMSVQYKGSTTGGAMSGSFDPFWDEMVKNQIVPSAYASIGSGQTTAAYAHSGGVIGAVGRFGVPSAWFGGAGRFHAGGIANDEVPAILQHGEVVLTRAQQAAIGPDRIASVLHSGGMAGDNIEFVPAHVWAGARRFHTGGDVTDQYAALSIPIGTTPLSITGVGTNVRGGNRPSGSSPLTVTMNIQTKDAASFASSQQQIRAMTARAMQRAARSL